MSVLSYKCPNCGADLHFNPETQTLICDHCLGNFSESDLETITSDENYNTPGEEYIEEVGSDSYTTESVNMYTCPSCGAQVVTDSLTSATICCYCHNPVVLTTQLSAEFKPSKVIPFKKDKDNALRTFKKWSRRKHFLPDDFASPSQLEKITGLYMPYWLVDCNTSGYLNATSKNTTRWIRGKYRYTKTDIYSVSRSASMSFSYLPHDASRKADDGVMDSIGPFNFNEIEDFSYSYLTGFMAEKYDVTKEEVYPAIKALATRSVLTELESSISGYDTYTINSSNVQIHDSKFHYSLLPVWILTYIYKGDTYLYAMNGQTGKTFGSLPLCKHKLNTFSTILFIILFLIVFFVLAMTGGLA